MTQPELDDEHVVAICRALTEHGVAFVVIGGVAGCVRQAPAEYRSIRGEFDFAVVEGGGHPVC